MAIVFLPQPHRGLPGICTLKRVLSLQSVIATGRYFQLILHVDVGLVSNSPNFRICLFISLSITLTIFSPVAVSFYCSSTVKLRFVNFCTNKRMRMIVLA